MSPNPIEVFEKRSAEWNMHSRPVLDRATWLLVHAAAARFAGLDPTTSDLAAVGQALRECPEVVTDALRLLDQADVRRASALMAAAARRASSLNHERQRKHARGLRTYLEHLRTDSRWYTAGERRVMERFTWAGTGVDDPSPESTFEEVLRGAGPTTNTIARRVLGGRLRWVKRDRARLLELVSSRMCEAQADVVARSAAALWLRLRGFTGVLAEAVTELEAEVERRA